MPTLLLTYATTHGHTAKIAERLAGALRSHGLDVDGRDGKHFGDGVPGSCDAVVAGASLHAGHHQRAMLRWVKASSDHEYTDWEALEQLAEDFAALLVE